jgi:hypothetical protein
MSDCIELDISHFLGYRLNLVKSLCDDGGTTRADMIEIIISLAWLKIRI